MNKFYLQCHFTVVLVKEGNSGERVWGGKPDKKKERRGKHDTRQKWMVQVRIQGPSLLGRTGKRRQKIIRGIRKLRIRSRI